jgi:heme-degrading monooxygenase HmoA
MHLRLMTFTGSRDVEGGVAYVRDEAVPILNSQRGYRGMAVSANEAESVFGIMSMWDTEADREASDSALSKARKGALKKFGGSFTIENYEQMAIDIAKVPGPGDVLMITGVRMNPTSVDENTTFFMAEIAPQIRAQRGFCMLRSMGDRHTGRGVLGTVWATQEEAAEAVTALQGSRSLAESRGIEVEDPSFREILFEEMV